MPRYFSAISSSFDKLLVAAVAPFAPGLGVQVLGERLGQPVGQRLDHDRVVVVVLGLEPRDQLVAADAGGDGERAEIIVRGRCRPGRRNRPASRTTPAPCAPTAGARRGAGTLPRRAASSAKTMMSSPVAGRRPEAVHAVGREQLLADRSDRAAPGRRRTACGPSRPTFGSSRICGYLPFSSQVRKNGDQSMYGRSSASGKSFSTLRPINVGRRNVDGRPVGRETGGPAPRHRARAWPAAAWRSDSTSCACSRRLSASNVGRGFRVRSASRPRRPTATHRARGHVVLS